MIALYYTPLPKEKARHRQVTRELLSFAAGEVWPALSPLPELETTPLGKPWFPNHPDCQFNLSHSGDWAFCVLSDHPVGVDLQVSRPLRANVARNFTPEEQDFLGSRSPEAFFDLWVKKEAYLKARGVGLTERLSSFSVLPLEENTPQPGYTIRLLPCPVDGYHLAVCGQITDGEEITPIYWKGTSL